MPLFYAWGTSLLAAMGRPDDALEDFARALEIAPDFGLAHFHAGMSYIQKGFLDQAIETFEKSRELGVAADWAAGLIGMCHEAKGDRAMAVRSFEDVTQMIERKDRGPLSFTTIGLLAWRLGHLDEAFEFFDRAYTERDPIMPSIHLYAVFLAPSLRCDPRFRDLLVRMRAPGYTQAG
jgi:tetratricopeptide (TPR) repeat protein